jgi:hypothetical protein
MEDAMGADGWNYLVPYQPDINAALQELRQQEFAAGNYTLLNPLVYRDMTFAEWVETPDETIDDYSEEELATFRAEYDRYQAFTTPANIEELLWYNGAEGVGNIIDMEGVAAEPTICAVAPLTSAQLVVLFGTERPTCAQVGCVAGCGEQPASVLFGPNSPLSTAFGPERLLPVHADECGMKRIDRYLSKIGRGTGEGTYIILYQDGTPHEIYFTGWSGD